MDIFVHTYLLPGVLIVVESAVLLTALLIFVAYVIYADRKIWAAVQLRRGPNVVGPWGLFQSFADLLKFVLKEPVIRAPANKGMFLLAPLLFCVLSLAAWAVIPLNAGWAIAFAGWGFPTRPKTAPPPGRLDSTSPVTNSTGSAPLTPSRAA